MYIYIKNNIYGNFLTSDVLIDTIDGYQDSVGSTWKDYENGKILLLSQEQVDFHIANPGASIKNVWDMEIPSVPEEPQHERTLEDAKNELRDRINAYYDSDAVCTTTIAGMEMWFTEDECQAMKLYFDSCAHKNVENVRIWYGNVSFVVPASAAYNILYELAYYRAKCEDARKTELERVDHIIRIEYADQYEVASDVELPDPIVFDQNGNVISQEEPTPDDPMTEVYVYYKLANAYAETPMDAVLGKEFHAYILPDEGYSILRNDFVCMMGDDNIPVQFSDDLSGRPEYASAVSVDIKEVTGIVTIATVAVSNGEPAPVPHDEKDFYDVVYMIDGCRIDNDIYSVAAHDHWKTSVYAEDGNSIYAPSVRIEMGGMELKYSFEPDYLGREDYFSSVMVEVDDVDGDIIVTATAHQNPE